MQQLYTLEKAPYPKKYQIWVINPKTSHQKKVTFGAASFSDFTLHKDIYRRSLYIKRHSRDKIYDPTTPGFWSMWVLWNYKSLKESLIFTLSAIDSETGEIDREIFESRFAEMNLGVP